MASTSDGADARRPRARVRRSTRWVPFALLVVVMTSLWYAQSPPRTPPAYEKHAALAASFLQSQLTTAATWVRESARDRVTHRALVVAIEEAETDAGNTLSSFAHYDPPPGTKQLRSRLVTLGNRALEHLAALRIAAHREEWATLPSLAEEARRTAQSLRRLHEAVAGR